MDEILNLIGSVSEGFPSFSFICKIIIAVWASSVKQLLQSLGFNYVWHYQGVGSCRKKESGRGLKI